jgi:hypothetical protein
MLRYHDMHTNFHKVWFRHSEAEREEYTGTNTDRMETAIAYFRNVGKKPGAEKFSYTIRGSGASAVLEHIKVKVKLSLCLIN